MRLRKILPAVLGVALAACSSGTAPASPPPTAVPTAVPTAEPTAPAIPSPGFVLRAAAALGACDAIGIEYQSLTWRIDPAADEPVTALTNTGVTLLTSWAPGFTAGSAQERVIRDPGGVIVVRDGDVWRVGDQLAGYLVCLGPEYVSVHTGAAP